MNINHLGIIVDGNGRWAKERGLSRSEGHKKGAENLEELILYIAKKKLANYLSLYVFSTENFKRDKDEVNYLMNLFMKWFEKAKSKYQDYDIKVVFSGHLSYLNESLVKAISELEDATKDNKGLVVNFCLSYGGRQEIIDATLKIYNDIELKKINLNDLDEVLFSKYLYHELPDVDFLIRTSGEMRISNFMLWQISYAEFYFPDTYFPDFSKKELEEALLEFSKRDRRFGAVKRGK